MRAADDLPILRLGLAGFDGRERGELLDLLSRRRSGPRWRLGAFADADAWLLNGARAQVLGPAILRVHPGLPSERSVRLDLQDVCRPVAFAHPLPHNLDALCAWDPLQPDGLEPVLQRLQQWLAPVLVAWTLGREVVERGRQMGRGIVHVQAAGKLLAVLDLRSGMARVAPLLPPAALEGASWVAQPGDAGLAPPGFQSMTVAQLAWTYVRHSDGVRLPPAYHVRVLYYRRAPRVPLRWLSDTQLIVLHELAAQGDSIEGLTRRTGLSRTQLEQDLSCLYHAGALTSTPSKATRGLTSEPAAPSSLPASAQMLEGAGPETTQSPWEENWRGGAYATVHAFLPPH